MVGALLGVAASPNFDVYKWESSVFSMVTGLIADAILVLFFICNAV